MSNAAPRPVSRATLTEAAARELRTIRSRNKLFPRGMFREPRWRMLLDLYAAEGRHARVSVSSLCIAAACPPTTALRHIAWMEANGWMHRTGDRSDGRRSWMHLTDRARDQLDLHFIAMIGGDGR